MAVVRGLAMGAMFVAPLCHSLGRAAGAVAVVALVVVALGAGVGVPAGRVRARQPPVDHRQAPARPNRRAGRYRRQSRASRR